MPKLIKIDKHSNLYRSADSDVIYYRKRNRGELIEFSTGETGINKAKNFIELKLSEKRTTKRSGLKHKKPSALIETLWESYIKDKQDRGIFESTIKSNRSQWNMVLKGYFKDMTVNDLTPKNIDTFEKWYLKKHPERVYLNCMKTLSGLIHHAKSLGYEIGDIKLKKLDDVIKANKRHKKVGRVFKHSEVEKILKASDETTALGVLFAYRLGLRKTEFLSLEIKNLEKNRLKVWSFKNKKWRTVFIVHDDLMQALDKHLKNCGHEKYVFESKNRKGELIPMHGQVFDRGWTNAKIEAGIKGATDHLRARVHDLRHTCATNFAQSNMPVTVACAILDMSLAIFEKVYVHVTEDSIEKHLKNLVGS